jgi:mannose-1-phosphate guanylyltransferase
MDPQNTYALILAGGSGTRFWPLSRDHRPKQFLDLFGEGTLLQQAVRRLEDLVPPERIFILTNQKLVTAVQTDLPELPRENIVAEPVKRDTGPAVALGTGLIAARNPDALMMVLPSDQLIRDTDSFRSVLRQALDAANSTDGLVTIGIRPTWACPSYGYLELGEPAALASPAIHPVREVRRFREKPSAETAAEFLRNGGFAWNAGMFVWSVRTVRSQLEKHAPDLGAFIDTLASASNPAAAVARGFAELEPRSIDYALMEKADRVLNVEANFDWDDVGSWISVAKYLADTGSANRANTAVTAVDAGSNIVFDHAGSHHVALLGVSNLIVVQTPDTLLVADRAKADEIRKLTALLPPDFL